MIDVTIPVLIRLVAGNEHSVCIAKIIRAGQRFYAEPDLIIPSFAVRFPKLELAEDDLEIIPSIGGGKPMYHRRGLVVLAP